MAVTGEQVYKLALTLIDEVTDTGEVIADNPNYYKTKAINFLTTLQTELLPPSITPSVIKDLSEELLISDQLALTALPYGLASLLLIQEDVTTAAFFNNRYEELKIKSQDGITTTIELAYDMMGGL